MSGRWFGCGWAADGVVTPWRPGGMVRALLAEGAEHGAACAEPAAADAMADEPDETDAEAGPSHEQVEAAEQLGDMIRRLSNAYGCGRGMASLMATESADTWVWIMRDRAYPTVEASRAGLRRISAIWPADLPWPDDVPRPDPTEGDAR